MNKMLVELLLCLAALLAYWLYQVNKKMEYWQSMGVKVPKATPTTGE